LAEKNQKTSYVWIRENIRHIEFFKLHRTTVSVVFFLIFLDQSAQVDGRVTFEQPFKQMGMFARVPPLARATRDPVMVDRVAAAAGIGGW